MDLYELKPADLVRLSGDCIAEVVADTQDGQWILVRYKRCPDAQHLEGTEDLCSAQELLGRADD